MLRHIKGDKRHILITGTPGTGKTTLIMKVWDEMKKKNIPGFGFYTEEVRTEKRREGFDVVTLDGKRGQLARYTDTYVPKDIHLVGKYGVNTQSFESVVLPLLDNYQQHKGVAIIDEAGKMELFSKPFMRKLTDVLKDEKRIVLATIPMHSSVRFIEELRNHPTTVLIKVTKDNRDALVPQVTDTVTEMYSKI